MIKKFLPREQKFFDLFRKQAAIIKQGLELFGEMVRNYDKRGELGPRIGEVEHDADDVTHEVLSLLDNTFVTPFDREDIQTLAKKLDDVMDMVEATTARMEIYDMPPPPAEVRELSSILNHAFENVAKAIGKLNDLKNREEILEICVEVNRLENEGDQALRLALRRLFKEFTDPLYVIKLKEIYENLEKAIDCCEDLADVFQKILAKNA